MFGLFGRRRKAKPRPQESEFPRAIFAWHDGTKARRSDPIDLWQGMDQAAGDDWPRLIQTIGAEPPAGCVGQMLAGFRKTQDDALDKIAGAVVTAFGVEPFHTADDGTDAGLTRSERVNLAVQLLDFMGRLAEAARPLPGSSAPTGSSPPA